MIRHLQHSLSLAPLMVVVAMLMSACSGSGDGKNHEPAGTSADPVAVCKRVADVCRIDRARLGVCTQTPDGSAIKCMSQH